MARSADEPGTYRVKRVGGEWKLYGLTRDRNRVKLTFRSEGEAKAAATVMFPKQAPIFNGGPVDDWGLPVIVPGMPTIGDDVASAVSGAMGSPGPVPPPPEFATLPPEIDREAEKKREASISRAKSLCEFFGIAYAGGVSFGSKKLAGYLNLEPANPSPKAITELGKAATFAFQDLIGDWEVGPWTMLLLLTIAMPTVMLLQSPKKRLKSTSQTDPLQSQDSESSSPLRAVPSS